MGKGDIKSKRGKIANKSYGVRRKRDAEKYIAPAAKVIVEKPIKMETPIEIETPVDNVEKKTTVKKPAAKKTKKEETAE